MTKEALTNQVVQIKPNPRDDFEKMDLNDAGCQFLYQNGDEFVFMNTKTFEEYNVDRKVIDPNLGKILESGTMVKLRLNGVKPIMVTSTPTVKCTVTEVQDVREQSDKKKYELDLSS